MLMIENILGNVEDKQWQERAKSAKIDHLELNQWDAQKNRFRRTTEQGNDVAVSLQRNTFLKNGDILHWDEAAKQLTVAKISLRDVLIIEIQELVKKDKEELVRLCFELGHALGNQHWPSVVRDNKIIVPLTVDKKVMTSVMRTHAFPDITYDFHPAETAVPYLLPHEARRLFGGADQGSSDMAHHTHGAHGGHGAVPAGHHSHDGGKTHHSDHDTHAHGKHEHKHEHADGTAHAHDHDECCGKADCCDHNHKHA